MEDGEEETEDGDKEEIGGLGGRDKEMERDSGRENGKSM